MRPAIIVLLLMAVFALSEARAAERRMALVITNAAYADSIGPLTNTHADGATIRQALMKVAFEARDVVVLRDAQKETMIRAIADFAARVNSASQSGPVTAFLYYSGHGASLPNDRHDNYLIPVGRDIRSAVDLPLVGIRLSEVVDTMRSTNALAQFVVIDACRNVLFSRGLKGGKRGFSVESRQRGMIIAFSTEPGETAEDTNIYSSTLARNMVRDDLDVVGVFKETQVDVYEKTNRRQVPWIEDGLLVKNFRFVRPRPSSVSSIRPKPAPEGALTPTSHELAPILGPGGLGNSRFIELAPILGPGGLGNSRFI